MGAGGNLISAATGSPKFVDEVAGREVADRMSTIRPQMADMAARTGGTLDTTNLAAQLRQPASIEEAVPGYQANIGDRSRDPGLATFAYNQDAVSPGAANARRSPQRGRSERTYGDLGVRGDHSQFRADLEASRDASLAGEDNAAMMADADLQQLLQRLIPSTPYAEDRGAAVRGGLRMPSEPAVTLKATFGGPSPATSTRCRSPSGSLAWRRSSRRTPPDHRRSGSRPRYSREA